jgi:hypothetical protein
VVMSELFRASHAVVVMALSMPSYAGQLVVGLCEELLPAYMATLQRGNAVFVRLWLTTTIASLTVRVHESR